MTQEQRDGGLPDQGAQRGAQVGAALGGALGTAAQRAVLAGQAARTEVRERSADVRARAADTDPRAVVEQVQHVLEGVLEDTRDRGGALVSAVSHRVVPQRRRTWRWALTAAAAGAAAGAAVAVLVRSITGSDAPDAQEPEQLRAVVDLGEREARTQESGTHVIPPVPDMPGPA